MAVVACKDCKGAVSTSAKRCPHCGAVVKFASRSPLWLILPLAVVLPAAWMYIEASKTPAEKAAEQARDKRIAMEIATTGLAHRKIRGLLKDPESARFSSVVYRESAELKTGVVCGFVNAKNSFGGYGGEQAFVVVDGVPYLQKASNEFQTNWDFYCRG